MKKIVIAVAVLGLAACGGKKDQDKKDDGSGSAGSDVAAKPPEPPKPAGRKIPNSDGLIVDAPAKWLDNGIGGAAGMHLDADQGLFMLRKLEADEAKQTYDKKVDELKESMAAPFVEQRKTGGGWQIIYVVDKLEMKGDKMVPNGTSFAFDVRRRIGADVYSCSGSAATKEIAQEAVALCGKVEKP